MFTDFFDGLLFEVTPLMLQDLHFGSKLLAVVVSVLFVIAIFLEGDNILNYSSGSGSSRPAGAANAIKFLGVTALVLYLVGGYALLLLLGLVGVYVAWVFIKSWTI